MGTPLRDRWVYDTLSNSPIICFWIWDRLASNGYFTQTIFKRQLCNIWNVCTTGPKKHNPLQFLSLSQWDQWDLWANFLSYRVTCQIHPTPITGNQEHRGTRGCWVWHQHVRMTWIWGVNHSCQTPKHMITQRNYLKLLETAKQGCHPLSCGGITPVAWLSSAVLLPLNVRQATSLCKLTAFSSEVQLLKTIGCTNSLAQLFGWSSGQVGCNC